MDIERFWKIVEASRIGLASDQADGNQARQLAALRTALLALPPSELVGFRDRLLEQWDVAFLWDLWGAAYLIAGGCSDDGFADFRAWLLSMGRSVFEQAIADADSLAGVAQAPSIEDVFFEEFLNVPGQVYEESTGREMPGYPGALRRAPAGERWSEVELERRLPRLWRQYGRSPG